MRKRTIALLGLIVTPLAVLGLAHGGNWLWAHGYLSTGIAEIASTGINIAAALSLTACVYVLAREYWNGGQTA